MAASIAEQSTRAVQQRKATVGTMSSVMVVGRERCVVGGGYESRSTSPVCPSPPFPSCMAVQVEAVTLSHACDAKHADPQAVTLSHACDAKHADPIFLYTVELPT